MDKFIDKKKLQKEFAQLVFNWNLNSRDVLELMTTAFEKEELPLKVLYAGNVLSNRVLFGKKALAIDVDGIRIPFAQDFVSASYDIAYMLARAVSVNGRYCHLMNEEEALSITAHWDDIMFCWMRVKGYSPCIDTFWVRKASQKQPLKVWSLEAGDVESASSDSRCRVVAVLSY